MKAKESKRRRNPVGPFQVVLLSPPMVPVLTNCFGWEGSSTKIDYRNYKINRLHKQVCSLILTSPLEDLVVLFLLATEFLYPCGRGLPREKGGCKALPAQLV